VLRAERGLSRQALADAVDVNYQTIGYLERGDYSPSLLLALKLSEYFRLPVEAIFSRTPFKPLTDQVYGRDDGDPRRTPMTQRPPCLRPSRLPRTLLACMLAAGLAGPVWARETAAVEPPVASVSQATALASFDLVWKQVDESDYRVGKSGLDWDQVRTRYRPRAQKATSPAELRGVLQEMLDQIGESHFVVIPQAATALQSAAADAAGAGNPAAGDAGAGIGRYGTGLQVRLVGGRLLVTEVEPGSSAAASGIAPGWALTTLEGQALAPMLAEIAALDSEPARQRARIVLQAGLQSSLDSRDAATPVAMGLVDARGRARTLSLAPQPRRGEPMQVPMLPPSWLQVDAGTRPLTGGGCVGFMRFNLWVPAVADRLDAAFAQMRDCRGVVLDLRGNPGGVMAVMMRMAGHFVTEPTTLGTLTTGGTALNFRALPRKVTAEGTLVQPYTGPVAVLVDQLSMSTSEMFASGMQAVGRARVFGTRSPGMALPARTVELPSGDLLMYAFAQYSDPLERRIEGVGVIPDTPAEPDRKTLLAGRDVAFDAALRWINDTAADAGADRTALPPTPRTSTKEQHR
jgi:carboxyl-terminal processing protease